MARLLSKADWPAHPPLRFVTTRKLTSLFLLTVSLFLASPDAPAFVLIPITMDFDPAGQGTHRTFRVENESDTPVAIQISMVTRKMDIDGKETLENADEDFAVYPPQIALGPKQNQSIRVAWTGKVKPAAELNYRIVAEQLPVALVKEQTKGAKINLLLRYLGTVYIVPKGAKADVVLESAAQDTEAAGRKHLVVFLHNRGTAHAVIRSAKMKLTAAAKDGRPETKIELGPEDLKGMIGENVLGGSKRRFIFPWPESLGDGPLEAQFEFIPQR